MPVAAEMPTGVVQVPAVAVQVTAVAPQVTFTANSVTASRRRLVDSLSLSRTFNVLLYNLTDHSVPLSN